MKYKEVIKSLLAAATLAGGLSACTYETIKPKPAEVPTTVSFSANVQPIFNKTCAAPGCHSKSGYAPDLTTANAYASLTAYGYVDTDVPNQSIIYEKIIVGSMKKYSSDQDAAIILKWIEQGALNN